jgi:hypothetical protein
VLKIAGNDVRPPSVPRILPLSLDLLLLAAADG